MIKITFLDGSVREYANLRHADLRYADFRFADLRYVNLQFADLRYANLRSADLRNSDLQFADLRNSDLQFANLQDANLQFANLQDADLDYSSWGLSCKTLKVKIDKRLEAQLLYHVISISVDRSIYSQDLLDFANTFHRVEECGKLAK